MTHIEQRILAVMNSKPHFEPTFLTPDRAEEIWKSKGPMGGDFKVTQEEDTEIKRVWQTLPGNFSWVSTLLNIMQKRHPVRDKTK